MTAACFNLIGACVFYCTSDVAPIAFWLQQWRPSPRRPGGTLPNGYSGTSREDSELERAENSNMCDQPGWTGAARPFAARRREGLLRLANDKSAHAVLDGRAQHRIEHITTPCFLRGTATTPRHTSPWPPTLASDPADRHTMAAPWGALGRWNIWAPVSRLPVPLVRTDSAGVVCPENSPGPAAAPPDGKKQSRQAAASFT